MPPGHIDQDALFRAYNEQFEEHHDPTVRRALNLFWEQHRHGILTLQEWVQHLASINPIYTDRRRP